MKKRVVLAPVLAMAVVLPGCSFFSKDAPPVISKPSKPTHKKDDWIARQAEFTYVKDPSRSDVAQFVRKEQFAIGKAQPVTHITVEVVWEDADSKPSGSNAFDHSNRPVSGELLHHATFHFDLGSASLTQDTLREMRETIDAIKIKPHRILVEGHTDSIGSDAYNKHLSEQRAMAVRQKLVEYGAAPDSIVMRAYGENKPVASNDTEEGRAKNRRVEVHWLAKQPVDKNK
ncbi:OmpA family protein [Thiolapillus sp.]|uniref:OmpA family protein n=2 Tax=Thiolapillus sp. TaxID=2017437 RepID=UPI0025F38198|nr:OmpA family protein [Thiolapillus sp.]